MNNLPNEVVFHILTYMNQKDLNSCSYVCKSWHFLTNDDRLWRRLVFVRFKLPNYQTVENGCPVKKACGPCPDYLTESKM